VSEEIEKDEKMELLIIIKKLIEIIVKKK